MSAKRSEMNASLTTHNVQLTGRRLQTSQQSSMISRRQNLPKSSPHAAICILYPCIMCSNDSPSQ
jgi:hypothetical protein